MDVIVYDIQGKEKGKTTLSDEVFNITPNKSAIYYSLRAELANARQGTASTKGRADVRGSSAKLFRQKGTGRARAGSRRSPIRVGGGVAFGPKPRSYGERVSKKLKRLGVVSVLSHKMNEQRIKVIEDFSVDSGKTKEFSLIAAALAGNEEKTKRVLILDREPKPHNRRAGRNIPWVTYHDANLISTKDLFYASQLLITESAAQLLNEKYS
jgi:large subunit ribosomal protein L4